VKFYQAHIKGEEAELFRWLRDCSPRLTWDPLARRCGSGAATHHPASLGRDGRSHGTLPIVSKVHAMDPHLRHDDQKALDDASRTELLASLNELLEAERAGARVAMETGREIGPRNSSHWWKTSTRTRFAGAACCADDQVPGRHAIERDEAFHGKAMAIAEVEGLQVPQPRAGLGRSQA
jgi:hypothetical protein